MKTKFELAQVIEQFLDEGFRKQLTVHHQRTLNAIRCCRTAALGGHVDACTHCGHLVISYNSCRNRNCPKCQGLQKEMWTLQREEELLPVAYFHVVFTLPHEINQIVLRNSRFVFNLLFESAWYVLNKFGRDPKWIGAQSAATMVLHTWGQNLQLHPHVHCIVPAGGLDKNKKWVNPRKGNSKFLYPILAMNKVYKAFFMRQLRAAIEGGLLVLPPAFSSRSHYQTWKENLYKKDWVVYAKPPFSKVKNVVDYLARYSHRIAITNARITNITESTVTFRYKDYRKNGQAKTMTLPGKIFLKRFCLHILPARFRKIRHYGFLANRTKTTSLNIAKKELLQKLHISLTRTERRALAKEILFGKKDKRCPCCGAKKLVCIDGWERNKSPPSYLMLQRI